MSSIGAAFFVSIPFAPEGQHILKNKLTYKPAPAEPNILHAIQIKKHAFTPNEAKVLARWF
jgi:hypothetical protein